MRPHAQTEALALLVEDLKNLFEVGSGKGQAQVANGRRAEAGFVEGGLHASHEMLGFCWNKRKGANSVPSALNENRATLPPSRAAIASSLPSWSARRE